MSNSLEHLISLVENFHTSFQLPLRRTYSEIPKEQYQLRHNLMMEEVNEYLEACQKGNKIAIGDALGDILYVLIGTIVEHGAQDEIVPILEEIHRSNMSKLDSEGNPIYREDGKILKGPNYTPPNLGPILID